MSITSVCIDSDYQITYNRKDQSCLDIFPMFHHALFQRRRSINEARMACAAMALLLLEQSQPYEPPSIKNQYSSCMRSMRLRYFRRTLMIGRKIFPYLSLERLRRYFRTLVTNVVSVSIEWNTIKPRTICKSSRLKNDLFMKTFRLKQ